MATKKKVPAGGHGALADRLLAATGDNGHGRLVVGGLPSAKAIAALAEDFLTAFFPEVRHEERMGAGDLRGYLVATLGRLEADLRDAVYRGFHRRCGNDKDHGCAERADRTTARMMAALPEVRAVLLRDVQAAFEADPAASGTDEIIACYPGLHAIAVYRAAHRLLREGAEILPRMLTEHAKSRTGIDIHPGAQIGAPFFIDHGTGIVVGETTRIGDGVRIYQGVTLGALSVKRRHGAGPTMPDGRSQRHPTIEDDVIIYANATILGGATVIGRGAVVGGNSFITYSVPAGIRVGGGM